MELSDKDKVAINIIHLYRDLVNIGLQYDYFNDNFTQEKLMKKFNISKYMWRKWYNRISDKGFV